ncbi:MAG TPA: HEPN domain-containing protein [Anaerolineae bacterium]|nr:HEPN domain-containing protein [Anaerolineae bacterium]
MEVSPAALTEPQPPALENLPRAVAVAISHFCDALLARFPDQIRRIILYGSFARGDYHAESDVDVLVVVGWEFERLPGGWYRSPYSEPRWRAIIDLSVTATLECERDVAPLVLSEEMYRHKSMDVAREADREGIPLYVQDSGVTPAGERLTALDMRTGMPDQPPTVAALKERAEEYDAAPADLGDPHLWLSMAEKELQVVHDLLGDLHHRQAISRAYYAMFYATKAALVAAEVRVKSHAGANSEFGRTFVKTGQVDGRYQAMLSRAGRDRQHSDYAPTTHPTSEDVERIVEDAEAFVAQARELVAEELSRRSAPT